MATYDYRCPQCENEEQVTHSMKENPSVSCSECDTIMQKMIPKTINFVLKGASWSGKNAKENSYRSQRRREMGRKMALKHDIPQIQPNYKGEICDSWEQAKRLAKADGVNEERYSKQVDNLKKQEHKTKEKRDKLLKGEA